MLIGSAYTRPEGFGELQPNKGLNMTPSSTFDGGIVPP